MPDPKEQPGSTDEPDEGRSEENSDTAEPVGPVGIPDRDKSSLQPQAFGVDPGVPLIVLSSGPSLHTGFGEPQLVTQITHALSDLLTSAAHGIVPLLNAITFPASVEIRFLDRVEVQRDELLAHPLLDGALAVRQLMTTPADELFGHAVALGEVGREYAKLVKLLGSRQLSLEWRPRDSEPAALTAEVAKEHSEILSKPGEPVEHESTITGWLYRFNGLTKDVSIKVVGRIDTVPGLKTNVLKAVYEDDSIADKIVHDELLLELVDADVVFEIARWGSSLDPEASRFVIKDIRRGPPEAARLGASLLDFE